MELVFYDVTPHQHRLPLNTNVFNCHICKHRHSSYPEVEAHYLTQHKNVIIVLKEGEKTSIRRHFVGPKSRRPNYWVERVNRANKAKRLNAETPLPIRASSLPYFSTHSPLLTPKLEPLEEEEVEDDDLTFPGGWEFDYLMMPEPSEDILGLLNCPELASEFNITADVPAIELSESENADIPDDRISSSTSELQKEQLGPQPTLTVDLDEIELTLQTPTERKFDLDVNQAKTDDMTPLTPSEQNNVLEMDEIELTLVTPTKRNLQLGAVDLDRIDDLTPLTLTPTKGELEALEATMYELSPLLEFKLKLKTNLDVDKDEESGEVDSELDEVLEFALRLEDEATNATAEIRELELLEHSR